MADIIDPFVYRNRYTMPKLVIDAGGDEFFQPDDNYYWWDAMPGEKHLLMIQNAEHSMATGVTEIIQSVSAFADSVFAGTERPSMEWQLSTNATGGSVSVTMSEEPVKLFVRWTDTLDGYRKDFRLVAGPDNCTSPRIPVSGACGQPILWKTMNATKVGPMKYTASFSNPESGWRAFFIEVRSSPGCYCSCYCSPLCVSLVLPVSPSFCSPSSLQTCSEEALLRCTGAAAQVAFSHVCWRGRRRSSRTTLKDPSRSSSQRKSTLSPTQCRFPIAKARSASALLSSWSD